ncbi:unnamed protein product [Ranitomeya imitator]|uniref:CCR4-NOT transcription complex subunit 10 n=1 Tax=Ranitomeya imitator TaxID=111125 RepID=A0ABN9M8H3_9NEOB|nr:unnamed protein product [Ranitomeya imitator]
MIALIKRLNVMSGPTNNNSTNKEALNMKSEGGAQLEPAKSKIHQCKVRAYIQMKSLKACKREIKSVMNTSGNSAPSLFLKSNFEYLRGNYRKAVKLLNSSNISEHPGFMKTASEDADSGQGQVHLLGHCFILSAVMGQIGPAGGPDVAFRALLYAIDTGFP